MSVDWTTLFHAAYVAFAFGVLFFGALAYRQILDNLELRRMRMGEDRDAFLSAPSVVVLIVLTILTIVLVGLSFNTPTPSIYQYALPLIIAVQTLQMALRIWFQRIAVKTRGIVVRSALFSSVKAVPYEEGIDIEMQREFVWTTVSIVRSPGDRVVFRIFTPSVPALRRVLEAWCDCQIRIREHR